MTKKPKELQDMHPGCASCRHWKDRTEPGDDERWGTCHRYPPVVQYTVDDGSFSMWPIVEATESCGELSGVN